jgi:hypothetical protein
MLKHYNEEETKTMAKTPGEAEKMSNDNKNTNTQKTPVKEGPMTRSRTKELEKQNQPKIFYSEVLKNRVQNISAQQNSMHNKNEAQKFGLLKSSVQNNNRGAQKVSAQVGAQKSSSARNLNTHKSSVQTNIKFCMDQQKLESKKDAKRDTDPLKVIKEKRDFTKQNEL